MRITPVNLISNNNSSNTRAKSCTSVPVFKAKMDSAAAKKIIDEITALEREIDLATALKTRLTEELSQIRGKISETEENIRNLSQRMEAKQGQLRKALGQEEPKRELPTSDSYDGGSSYGSSTYDGPDAHCGPI